MIAYTIAPALESGVFDVGDRLDRLGGDRGDRAALRRRGAVPAAGGVCRRHLARHRVARAHARGAAARRAAAGTAFSLLRPTSPFRTADTIRRAWSAFTSQDGRRFAARGREVHAASGQDVGRPRATGCFRCCRSSPSRAAQPWHSTPYQALPPVYVQNASLEIAWTRVVRRAPHDRRRRAGAVLTEGYEGFDINDPYDWMVAERLFADGAVQLPAVRRRRIAAGRERS